ncbi:serine/threonine-protein kinase [Chondromyces apiculatus]|uniref:Protein kinase n=1 Tax=Chondromyces apiculatus DSM 436 TaxID=1192034 RepID=A0A017SXQ2_9BACT|nr:serine/threonine-protein kinase [Chondromyces apiculatus]EYF01405.1 protein kinase [Chondromyces apiculatus DSM 436]
MEPPLFHLSDVDTVEAPVPPSTTSTVEAQSAAEEPPRSSWRGRGMEIAKRYQLLDRLGQGAAGEVWRAVDTRLRAHVAIKLLLPRGSSAELIARQRFVFEAQVEARLAQSTSHVVAVHDSGHDPRVGSFMVMEYVQGRTLRDHLNKHGQMSVPEALSLFEQVADAIIAAHREGIVHRDLKPSNLLLLDGPSNSFHVKVADFGLAKGLRSDLSMDMPPRTAYGTVLGTLSYMSPEQLQGLVVDEKTDLWSIAVILYEALTGVSPFRAETPAKVLTKLLLEATAAPSTIRRGLPRGFDGWFATAFAADPSRRFRSVEQMLEAFRLASATSPLSGLEARAGGTRRHASWAGWAFLAGLVATSVGCGAALVLQEPEAPGLSAMTFRPQVEALSAHGLALARASSKQRAAGKLAQATLPTAAPEESGAQPPRSWAWAHQKEAVETRRVMQPAPVPRTVPARLDIQPLPEAGSSPSSIF